jgi:hypothetical protein
MAITLSAAVAIDEALRTKIYLTYELTNPTTGQVYSGRTSGYGDPDAILRKRLQNHHMVKLGFTEYEIDRTAVGQTGRVQIRGREQMLIDKNGGAQKDCDPNGKCGTSGNAIRGVAKINPKGEIYYEAAGKRWGYIAPYTGYRAGCFPLWTAGACDGGR